MRFTILLILISFFAFSLTGQGLIDLSQQETQLLQYSNQFLKDTIVEKRQAAAKGFSEKLASTLKEEHSFSYPFEDLETVSILYPEDSTFRIFTWQIYIDNNDYRYGGLIQLGNSDNTIFPLTDKSAEVADYDLEFDILGAENWYGAVYFNIHTYDTKEGKKYLLFGFDGYHFFNKRKILEVFYFDKEGQPVFGAPAFAKTEAGYEAATKNRIYVEYSAEVAAKLNYDPLLEMIILDNMVSMRSPYKGVGNVNIPDGSYIGYKLNNGQWEYVEKVFHLVSEEAPAPRPILNGKTQKDLFGKEQKGKKRDKKLPFKNK